MKTFKRISDIFSSYVSYLGMIAMVFMMGYMFLDVVLRLVGDFMKWLISEGTIHMDIANVVTSFKGGYEVSTLALCVLIFTSWCYAQTQHAHVHVTMFIRKFPNKLRFLCFSFTSMASTVVIGILTYAAFVRVGEMIQLNTATGTLMIPFWPFVAVEAVTVAAFALILLRDTIRAIMSMFNQEYAEEIMATWEGS